MGKTLSERADQRLVQMLKWYETNQPGSASAPVRDPRKNPMTILLGKANEDIATGASGQVTIWNDTVSPPTATTRIVTAYWDWIDPDGISSGDEVAMVKFGGIYRILLVNNSSSSSCSCCSGMCGGDGESRWIDNFESYSDGDDLEVYEYPWGATAKDHASGRGIELGTLLGVEATAFAGRRIQLDVVRFKEFRFAFTLSNSVALDAAFWYDVGADPRNAQYLMRFQSSGGGSYGLITLGGSVGETATYSPTIGDRVEIVATVSLTSETDTTVTIGGACRVFIDGSELLSNGISGTPTKTTMCDAAYGLELAGVGSKSITDDWNFKALHIATESTTP